MSNIVEKAKRLRKQIEVLADTMTDEEGLQFVDLFPNWETEHAYQADDRVKYSDTLYKCVQGHTSQEDWTPDITKALWTKISIEEWPEWIQPTGAQDAYMLGDKVSHNEKHWVSTVDNNVWEPGVYGWDEVI